MTVAMWPASQAKLPQLAGTLSSISPASMHMVIWYNSYIGYYWLLCISRGLLQHNSGGVILWLTDQYACRYVLELKPMDLTATSSISNRVWNKFIEHTIVEYYLVNSFSVSGIIWYHRDCVSRCFILCLLFPVTLEYLVVPGAELTTKC